jgi:hypothetical protein
MSTPWPFLEAEVLHRLNSLQSLSPADHVTSYETIPKTTTVADDTAFALTSVREAIVDTVMEVIAYICQTDGDPRRQRYKLTASVAHGGESPNSMGPYGAVFDPATGRPLEPRSATEIGEIRANVNNAFGNPPPAFFYMAIDGQKLYHTLAADASVECFSFDRPATNYAALNALFSTATNFAPIPDEFGVVVADGAAGRIAGKAGSLIQEAANFMQLYYQGLKERGLNVRMQMDFPALPAA